MKDLIKKYMESVHGNCEVSFTSVIVDPITFKPMIGVMVNGNPIATYCPETITDEIAMCGEIKDVGMHLIFEKEDVLIKNRIDSVPERKVYKVQNNVMPEDFESLKKYSDRLMSDYRSLNQYEG